MRYNYKDALRSRTTKQITVLVAVPNKVLSTDNEAISFSDVAPELCSQLNANIDFVEMMMKYLYFLNRNLNWFFI